MGLSGCSPIVKSKSIYRVNLTHFLGEEERVMRCCSSGYWDALSRTSLVWRDSLLSCLLVGWESTQLYLCRITLSGIAQGYGSSWGAEIVCIQRQVDMGYKTQPPYFSVGHLCRAIPTPELPIRSAKAFVTTAWKSTSLYTQSCFLHPPRGCLSPEHFNKSTQIS